MTRFGKLLVLLNLAFSLMLATWAFSAFANGIDWTDRKAGSPPIPVGEFAKRAEKLDEAWKGIPTAQASWLSERAKLLAQQERLTVERAWYDVELRHVFVGRGAEKLIGEVVLAAKDDDRTGVRKGQVMLDDKGFPRFVAPLDRADKPLQLLSLAEYNQRDGLLLNELRDVMKKHEDQIAEANRLTDLIIGDKERGLRGFQQRINDERDKDAEVRAELKLVEPLLINTVVEAQLIDKRHQQLVRRIEELRKVKVAGK